MEYKDYYAVMGLASDATQADIKRAYRKLARKFHPDVSKEPDAEKRFKELGEAYEVLKDPEKRAAYDTLGSQWQSGQDFQPPPNWDAGFEFSGGEFNRADATGFSDFFETLFGRATEYGHAHAHAHPRHDGPRAQGEDHYAKVVVSLEDATQGARRQVVLQSPQLDKQGHLHLKDRTLNVTIPPGVRDGQLIRLKGQGATHPGASKPGDLYLEINIDPHPVFRVDGDDVHVDLSVTPWEVALGARVHAPTLSGPVAVKLPTQVSANSTLRLKGRGLPGKPAGDQYVHLRVIVPPARTEEALACYRTLAESDDSNPRKDEKGAAA